MRSLIVFSSAYRFLHVLVLPQNCKLASAHDFLCSARTVDRNSQPLRTVRALAGKPLSTVRAHSCSPLLGVDSCNSILCSLCMVVCYESSDKVQSSSYFMGVYHATASRIILRHLGTRDVRLLLPLVPKFPRPWVVPRCSVHLLIELLLAPQEVVVQCQSIPCYRYPQAR